MYEPIISPTSPSSVLITKGIPSSLETWVALASEGYREWFNFTFAWSAADSGQPRFYLAPLASSELNGLAPDALRPKDLFFDSSLPLYRGSSAPQTPNTDDLPLITVVVSSSAVGEDSEEKLVYTLTRTGSLSEALTVTYRLGGTASGNDYKGVRGGRSKTITFAPNSATAILVVEPKADAEVEEDETVSLSLVAGDGYVLATNSPVVGVITNDDQILEGVGNTKLIQNGLDQYYAQASTSSPVAIKYKFSTLNEGLFPELEILAAENLSGQNQILWKNPAENYLQVWSFNTKWQWTTSGPTINLASPEALTLETAFGVDANGDGQIGNPPSPGEVTIGANLSSIVDWSTAYSFVDAFKSSRPWTLKNSSGGTLNLDEHGWVKSLPAGAYAETILYIVDANAPYVYPGGQYVVLYEGEGTLSYTLDAVKNLSASTPGRDVINITPQYGFQIQITATNPNNYLRNIRVIPSSAETTYLAQPFNPDYLAKVDPFDALRFMDWMNTNNSTQMEWSNRPTLNTATWQGIGAPVEIMVQLANDTDSAPWFNMPHMATDEYVRNFAIYVRDHLDPDLKIYVEHSNEVWNPMFSQYYWALEQSNATWPDSTASDWDKVHDWHSFRTTQITTIWDQVFGANKERVIGVMGGMSAYTGVINRALEYAWTDNPLSHEEYGVDAIGIAPYFGYAIGSSENQNTLTQWTKTQADGGLNKLFQEIFEGGQLPNTYAGGAIKESGDRMAEHSVIAQQEGLLLLASEGGQSLISSDTENAAVTELFIKANRDPRMAEAYEKYLTTWQESGGSLLSHYGDIGVSSKYGSWGALEHVNQPGSPKYDALVDFSNRLVV